ncbi:MAG: hypothetical protein ACXVCY_11825 [Pseudobdellovibrionaceae bacterium]
MTPIRKSTQSLMFFAALIWSSVTYAADFYNVPTNGQSTVDEWGTCKIVNNNSCGLNIFIPTRSNAEWTSFYTSPPSCVTIASCPPPAPPLASTTAPTTSTPSGRCGYSIQTYTPPPVVSDDTGVPADYPCTGGTWGMAAVQVLPFGNPPNSPVPPSGTLPVYFGIYCTPTNGYDVGGSFGYGGGGGTGTVSFPGTWTTTVGAAGYYTAPLTYTYNLNGNGPVTKTVPVQFQGYLPTYYGPCP